MSVNDKEDQPQTLQAILSQPPEKRKPGRKKGASAVAVPRTLEWLSDRGYTVDITQWYNAFSGRRKDLYNIFDILAFTDTEVVGVQVCTTDFSAHLKKMMLEHDVVLRRWLRCASRRVMLFSWRKLKYKRGSAAYRIRGKIIEFYLDGNVIKWIEVQNDAE
jgi:hypothetical protein